MNPTLAFVKNPDTLLGAVGPDEALLIMFYPDWEVAAACTKDTLVDSLRSTEEIADIIGANADAAVDVVDSDTALADALSAWADLLVGPPRGATYLDDVPPKYEILLAWTAAAPAQEWACVVARPRK